MFTHLDLDYTTWVVVKGTVTNAYYIDDQNRYLAILVDATNKIVSQCELIYLPIKSANVIAFETTYKPGATAVNSVDEAIALEVY